MENNFNSEFRARTKALAVRIIKMYGRLPKSEETRIIGRQIIRSATSVAANFRAACRARSDAEYFSKLCIVVEETDETLFWLELLEETELVKPESIQELKKEVQELVSVFATTRKKLKLSK